MAANQTYNDFYSYFKELAVKNKLILHTSDEAGIGGKRFFASDIQSFIMDQSSHMAGWDVMNCVMHFIDPQLNIDTTNSQEYGYHQCMFFIYKGIQNEGKTNDEQERIAKNVAEQCVRQLLARMKYDSRNGEPVLNRSLDTLKGVRITPASRLVSQAVFLGWQVSFKVVANWDVCYDVNDWNP